MCGVFAFLSSGNHGPDLRRLQKIAIATERRGPHAFGWSWIDAAGRLRSFKQRGRISSDLGLLTMLAGARLVIGHTRYATQGEPGDNVNNHPHPVDGGWLVHNGVIANYDRLVDQHELHPSSDCDSEVLGLLIEQGTGTLLQRTLAAVKETGRSPLVMLGLWSRPERLLVVRAGNPLCRGNDDHGTYLGSLPDNLPGNVQDVPDQTATLFQRREGELQEVSHPCRRSIDRGARLPWYVR